MVGGSAGFQSNRSDLDSAISLYNHVKLTMPVYSGCMYGIVTSKDEAMFATVGVNSAMSDNHSVTVWRSDRKPLAPLCSFSTHKTFVHSMVFLESCPLLLSCSDKLVICDYEQRVILSTVESPRGPFTCMTSSSVSVTGKGVNGTLGWQQIFCGTRTNEIVCYDIRQKFYDARLCAVFSLTPDTHQVGHPGDNTSHIPMLCAVTTLADKYICAAWTNGVVDVLSQRVGTPLLHWQAHTMAVVKLQFLSEKRLLTACKDGSICVWELRGTEKPVMVVKFTGLNALLNGHTLCVTECGTDLTVMAIGGDVLLSNSDMDLREYSHVEFGGVQSYVMKADQVCDGITGTALNKLRLGVMAVCPMRRIALCGSEDGKLYVIQ